MARKFIWILLLSLIHQTSVSAQQNYRLSAELGLGTMLIPENKTLLNDYIPNVSISMAKSMHDNKSEWIRRMHVSYQELTFTYMNQSNLTGMLDTAANSFGNVYMLTYSLMINLLGREKNHLYFIPGWGIAYDTKTFYENSKNIYIGSHINYAIRFEWTYDRKLNSNTHLLTGIKYMHYSNGAFVLPNRGINSLSYTLGLAYQFKR
jgi:hypothetical protein